jgi:hypothetical protein
LEPIQENHYLAILSAAGIERADPSLGIGKQLVYRPYPIRTIVIYLGENDENGYAEQVALTVLNLAETWVLVPRYGDAEDLGVSEMCGHAEAILYQTQERPALAEYLATRPMDQAGATADLYVLSGNGRILVTWDHHTADEGLSVNLLDVATAGRLLVALNTLGAEMEVFHAAG